MKPASLCGVCNVGTFAPANLSGSTWRYRGVDLVVPGDIHVEKCGHCGAVRARPETFEVFDELLGPLFEARKQ